VPVATTSDRELLRGNPDDVAPRLLGGRLSATGGDGEVVVRITEVEAYGGELDPGSHSYRGHTERNAVMYGDAGHLYVYFTYGMHWCMNVVCATVGTSGAVLLRAGEVVAGHDLAAVRRPAASRPRDLARGPARLAAALGVTGGDNGRDLLEPDGPLRLELAAEPIPAGAIGVGPRVGLRLAGDVPWRFWIGGDPTVSTYRPAVVRPKRG
jgi:DNA-3-methyladenine glycosylase